MRRVLAPIALALGLAVSAGCLPNAGGRPPVPVPEPECAYSRIYPPTHACPR